MSPKKKNSEKEERTVDDVVLILSEDDLEVGSIEAHSKSPGESAYKSLTNLQKDWGLINQQVVILLDQTEQTTSKTGYQLDEIQFALGINAKGQIGFLAGVEVGGEASITLTFKRKEGTPFLTKARD